MQTQRYAKDVQEKKEQYEHYNILPLHAVGVKPAIMELPEVIITDAFGSFSSLACFVSILLKYKYAIQSF